MKGALHLVRSSSPPPLAVEAEDTVVTRGTDLRWYRDGESIDNDALVVLIFSHDVVLTW